MNIQQYIPKSFYCPQFNILYSIFYELSYKLPVNLIKKTIVLAATFLLDIMDTLIDMQKKYPEIGHMWFGPKLYYTVSKPEHIEKILTSQKALDKDYLYKFLSYVIGEGLITARGKSIVTYLCLFNIVFILKMTKLLISLKILRSKMEKTQKSSHASFQSENFG